MKTMKKNRLILINIYSTETKARYLLSSYVLKAYLKKHHAKDDLEIEILNFSDKDEVSEICSGIHKKEPDFVGYSCYVWNIEKILEVVKSLKEKSASMMHIFGGPEISPERILSLNPRADYYVIGEGERKLCSLLSYLTTKKSAKKSDKPGVPKGVAFWKDNKLNYSADTGCIKNLDEIPSIYLTGTIDDELYSKQQAFLETQRGCIYKCKYCTYHKSLPSVSYYSLERVFSELDHLIVKKQIKSLRIFDAVFTSDIRHAKSIVGYLAKLKDKGIKLPWIFWELTPQNVDEEFIRLVASLKYRENINNSNDVAPSDKPQLYSDMLKDYTVVNGIGIQSFCEKSLKAVGRINLSKKKLDDFMGMVKKHNIALKIDLILGLPFETFDSYFEGLEFFLPYFRDTDHVLNIHLLQILPGSDLEKSCSEYGLKYSLTAPHRVFSTPDFSGQELDYASKLTAVLFRAVNSPLRKDFFNAKEASGKSFLKFTRMIMDKISDSEEFKKTKIVREDYVDDLYWNDDAFREIPSAWLLDFLRVGGSRS